MYAHKFTLKSNKRKDIMIPKKIKDLKLPLVKD